MNKGIFYLYIYIIFFNYFINNIIILEEKDDILKFNKKSNLII
jgi:hypothetical protein